MKAPGDVSTIETRYLQFLVSLFRVVTERLAAFSGRDTYEDLAAAWRARLDDSSYRQSMYTEAVSASAVSSAPQTDSQSVSCRLSVVGLSISYPRDD